MESTNIKKWFSREVGIKFWLILFVISLLLLSLGLAILAVHFYKTSHFPARLGYFLYYLTGQSVSRLTRGLIIGGLGIFLLVLSFWQMRQKIIQPILGNAKNLGDLLYQQKKGIFGPKIVVIGGGTGLANLLRGLKDYTSNITAVVAMTDDGKSTGRLRADFNTLPPGDLRNCIVALSPKDSMLRKLFDYRFNKGKGLVGHSFGNLFIVALSDIAGGFDQAIAESSRILTIAGKVLPSTLDNIKIGAEFIDGQKKIGETKFVEYGQSAPIKKIFLKPGKPILNPEVKKCLREADQIIIGPGSLYTSILPNFLVPGLTKAIVKSRAQKIYICNVSTERGETQKYSVIDHIKVLIKYSDPNIVDQVLVNSQIIRHSAQPGKLGNISNITTKKNYFGRIKIVKAHLINLKEPLYHNSQKLARKIISMGDSKIR